MREKLTGTDQPVHHYSLISTFVISCQERSDFKKQPSLCSLVGKVELGPNKHGLVTYIQVNVYIGNTLNGSTVAELSKLMYGEV